MRQFISPTALLLLLLAGTTVRGQDIESAKKAFDSENYEQAIEVLEADIKATRKNEEALTLLVRASLFFSDFDRATSYAIDLTKLAPKSYDSHRYAAQAFYFRAEEVRQGGAASAAKIEALYENAVLSSREAVKLKSDAAEMYSYLGHALYWLQQFPASGQAFEDAARYNTGDADLLFYSARSWNLAKNVDKAFDAAKRAAKRNPSAHWLQSQLGQMAAAKGDFKSSVAAYSRALEVAGSNTDTAVKICQGLHEALGKPKRYADCIEVMKAWTKAHARTPLSYIYLGWYQVLLKDDPAALETYAACYKASNKTHAASAAEAAMCCYRMGKRDEAAQWMVKAHQTSWNWPTPAQQPKRRITQLAVDLVTNRRFEEAVKFIEKYAVPLDRKDWAINNSLGLVYRDWGESVRGSKGRSLVKKSVSHYKTAMESVLKDRTSTPTERAMVLNDYALLYQYPQYHINDLSTAVSLYRKSLKHDQEYIDALENLGLCLNALGKYKEAIGLFDKVLAKQPMRRMSRRGRAAAQQALKR